MATYTVDTTDDIDDGNTGAGELSLREALALANANAGADTIVFASGLTGTIRLDGGDGAGGAAGGTLTITDAVTIDGDGDGRILITGDVNDDDATVGATDVTDVAATAGSERDDNVQIFDIQSAVAVTFDGLTITGAGAAGTGRDGAISAAGGDITLIGAMVTGNAGAGIATEGGTIDIGASTVAGATDGIRSDNGAGGNAATVAHVVVNGGTVSGGSRGIVLASTLADTVTLHNAKVGGSDPSVAGSAIQFGSGNNTLFLSGGNVTPGYAFGSGHRPIDAGGGIDTLDVTGAGTGVTADFNNGNVTGIGTLGIGSFERLIGTNLPDAITGGGAAERFFGGTGSETMAGNGGDDELHGEDDNDVLFGGTGSDSLYGGNGDDRLEGGFTQSGVPSADYLDGGDGIDTANYSSGGTGIFQAASININLGAGTASGGYANGDTLVNIENVDGSTFADILTGDTGANRLRGNDGDDTLSGGGGNDALDGEAGAGDAASYSGAQADYTIGRAGTAFVIADNRGGTPDGTDTVVNVETFAFSDITLSAANAETQSLIVTTLADVVDAFDGVTSLREALTLANSGGGDQTVTFDGALDGTIRLTASLNVSDHVTIRGNLGVDGRPSVTISGDVAGDDTTLTGTDVTDIQASQTAGTLGDNVRIIDHSYGFLTLENMVLTGGVASDYGGAVWSHTGDAQQLTATGVSFAGNSAGIAGGAVWTGKEAEFTATTISGNVAGSSTAADALGGGVFANNVDFENVTISGNSVIGIAGDGTTGQGGGVFASAGIVNSMENVTVTGNYATNHGGGIAIANTSTLVLRGSIVSGNDAGVGGDEIRSLGTTADHNIIGTQITDASTVIGSTTLAAIFAGVSNNPFTGIQSGTLGDNGGPVQTVALLASALNPALDLGTDSTDKDARGVGARDYSGLPNDPSGSGRDLGAYELDENLPAIARDDTSPIPLGQDIQVQGIPYPGGAVFDLFNGQGTITDPGIEFTTAFYGAQFDFDASSFALIFAANGVGGGGTYFKAFTPDGDFLFLTAAINTTRTTATVLSDLAVTVVNGAIEVTGSWGYSQGQSLVVDYTTALKEDRSFTGDLFADNGAGADFDADGDAIAVTHINGAAVIDGQVIILPSGARLTIRADGTYDYETSGAFNFLAPGATATESFTYTIAGGSTATVSFSIAGVDTAPLAVQDAVTTRENVVLNGSVFANNGSGAEFDPDGGAAPVVATVNGSGVAVGQAIVLPSGAKLTLNADGTFAYDPNGVFDLLPAANSGASNLSEQDSFTYTLTGGSTATVTVTVTGVDSNDQLLGTAGDDTLRAGAGNDTLNGGLGANDLRGGSGDDTYRVKSALDLTRENASNGFDTVFSKLSHSLSANIEALHLDGPGDLWGNGNNLNNVLFGNGGANALDGRAGADTIGGGDGDDTITGGTGADRMRGNGGNDVYHIDTAHDRVYEDPNEGTDTIYSSVSRNLDRNVEILRLSGGDDLRGNGNDLDNLVAGNGGANLLYGYEGADSLEGGEGNDSLNGGIGTDLLTGGGGNDTLDGGEGADEMNGGNGDDTYFVDTDSDMVIETSSGSTGGADIIYSTASFLLGANIEDLRLRGGDDLTGDGNNLDNVIIGNKGNNQLLGEAGADTLSGGEGNDSLVGGTGSDLLIGGHGDDLMDGGAAADTFRFASSRSGRDVIEGFETALDRFDLAGGSFSYASETNGSTTLTHAGGEIVLTGVTGLSLDAWNALVLPAGTAASDGHIMIAVGDIRTDGGNDWTISPLSSAELQALVPLNVLFLPHADFLAC